MKDFENQVEKVKLVDYSEHTLHFEVKHDSVETFGDCYLSSLVWRIWMASYEAFQYLGRR